MKLSMSLARALSLLPATALAHLVATRQTDLVAITDSYLFDITLPQFITYRNAKNPSTLDWSSDGCTSSPDNPLGFNFVPACNRHDFGYNNYRDQSRFTVSAKDAIDSNFLSDLKYQCDSETLEFICDALAQVYYAAVRAFGGGDATPGKRSPTLAAAAGGAGEGAVAARDMAAEWVAVYQEKVAAYNQLVSDAGMDDARISSEPLRM